MNNRTTWTYDRAGRVSTEIDPRNNRATYTYDAANELTRITDRLLRQREFLYDNDGRMTHEKWLDGAGNPIRTFTYTYDNVARLTGVTELDSTYAFTYDNADRLLTINNSATPNMPQVTLTIMVLAFWRRTAAVSRRLVNRKWKTRDWYTELYEQHRQAWGRPVVPGGSHAL